MNEIKYTNINYRIQKFSTKYTNEVQKTTTQYTRYMIHMIKNKRKTRLTYNCAHIRSTKESLTLEGGTGWYLVVLGQYGAALVSRRQHWLVVVGAGSVWSVT